MKPGLAHIIGKEIVAPYDVQPESLAGLMTRDLDAWIEAKAAVERARRKPR